MGVLLPAPTPFEDFGSIAFDFMDAFFYSCEFLLQLVSVLFQPFLFLFCGYETTEECTASTPAAAAGAGASTSSRSRLGSSWPTHFHHPLSMGSLYIQILNREAEYKDTN